jgi:toxin HigB-1
MIKSFRHKGLKQFFETGDLRKIQAQNVRRLTLILTLLDAASDVGDVNFPGSQFHSLKGDRRGEYALSVSGNWRITFRFENGDVYDLNYEDYH